MTVRPGFAPIELGWGWMLVGIMIGLTMTLLVLFCCGKIRHTTNVNLETLAQLLDERQRGQQHRQAQDDVLRHLFAGGRPALEELARASGRTEAQFLMELLDAGAPGLQLDRLR